MMTFFYWYFILQYAIEALVLLIALAGGPEIDAETKPWMAYHVVKNTVLVVLILLWWKR